MDEDDNAIGIMDSVTDPLQPSKEANLIVVLKCLLTICCHLIGYRLKDDNAFSNLPEEKDFEALLELYTTNASILREFTVNIKNEYLFPPNGEKSILNKKDFMHRAEECKYILVKPIELRKRFTEFVFNN